jgi:hypothetical protein
MMPNHADGGGDHHLLAEQWDNGHGEALALAPGAYMMYFTSLCYYHISLILFHM